MQEGKRLGLNVIAPIALLIFAILAVLWFDFTSGGEARPEPLLGAIGTPIRGAFIAPTATPPGLEATPRPRPTFVVGARGTPEERDERRRVDLLLTFEAANRVRQSEGAYPSTGGNLQTLCAFTEHDVGCAFGEFIEGGVPADPLGEPHTNGYWYESDGRTMKLYAALEQDITAAERCPTINVDLRQKHSLICITAP